MADTPRNCRSINTQTVRVILVSAMLGAHAIPPYFSPVHHSCSRIDYFLVSSSFMASISDTQIYPIAISDHAPVSLSVINRNSTPPARNWRFNILLLKDPVFLQYFEREWTIFLETNNKPSISPAVLWETPKRLCEGKLFFTRHTKKRKRDLWSLNYRLKRKCKPYSRGNK